MHGEGYGSADRRNCTCKYPKAKESWMCSGIEDFWWTSQKKATKGEMVDELLTYSHKWLPSELLRALVMLMLSGGSKRRTQSTVLPNLKMDLWRLCPPEYSGKCSSKVLIVLLVLMASRHRWLEMGITAHSLTRQLTPQLIIQSVWYGSLSSGRTHLQRRFPQIGCLVHEASLLQI